VRPSDPHKLLEDLLVAAVPVSTLDVRGEFLDRLEREGPSFLEVHLAALPRKAGRDYLAPELARAGEASVALGALRACDLVAADLLIHLPDPETRIETLYFQGDAEERRMVLRALPFLSPGDHVVRLMEEAHRTNDEVLFAAGNLDSDLATRLLSDAAYNRVVLKCAFLGEPKERLQGWADRGNPELSLTLFDFMSERQAAGRDVWPDTGPLCALAPESLRERAGSEEDPTLRAALNELLQSL